MLDFIAKSCKNGHGLPWFVVNAGVQGSGQRSSTCHWAPGGEDAREIERVAKT